MTHTADVALVVQTVSAFLYVALGVWVLTLTPRRLQTKLLGSFAVLFGMIFLPTNLGEIVHLIEDGSLLRYAIQASIGVPAFLAMLGLAWAVPEPLEDRRLLGVALALGVGIVALVQAVEIAQLQTYQQPVPIWVDFSLDLVSIGASFAALFLLPLRARPARDPSRDEVTQLALLGVALPMLFAFVSGANVPDLAENLAQGQPVVGVESALTALSWVVVAGFWGWNMVRADDDTVRIHRAAMLGILGLFTAGAVYFAAFPGVDPGSNVMRGVMRTLGVGLLAYGVLRHDLAGLDEKVEYGVSRTTMAGMFVAVFFVVSEGAQVLFAGFAGSEFLGVLAAGALVFFLAPIQRMADELAARAVPGGAAAAAGSDEESYRRAVEATLADGEVTDDEEQHLAELVDELDISSARAYELRREVEADMAEDEPP